MSMLTGDGGHKLAAFPDTVRIITDSSVSTPSGIGTGVNSTVLVQYLMTAQVANAISNTQVIISTNLLLIFIFYFFIYFLIDE